MFLGLFKKKVKVVKVKRKNKSKQALKTKAKVKKAKTKTLKVRKQIAKPKRKRLKVKKTSKVVRPIKKMPQTVGKVTHYFLHVKAGVILVTDGKISLGDTLLIKGHTTDFKQKVTSMQINNVSIKEARPGQEVGLLVKSRVRHNDIVYKL